MVKLFGIVFLMVGSVGFSASICTERKKQRMQLMEMKHMFLLMQDDIRYSGLPISLIIRKTTDKVREPFSKALLEISNAILLNGGEQFYEVWEKEMQKISAELLISEKQQELLCEFPKALGLWEREGQANALSFYIEETDKWIVQMEKDEKDKNRVIMSLGAAAGILLSVLLL